MQKGPLLTADEPELPPGAGITRCLPPHRPDGTLPPHSGTPEGFGPLDLGPYRITLTELVDTFGTTPGRCAILEGLLAHRAALRTFDLVNGFQWLGGSFVDFITEPKDLDLVTFFVRPRAWKDSARMRRDVGSRPDLFDPKVSKVQHRVDGYFVDVLHRVALIRWSYHWHFLYGHDRRQNAKGFVEIPLQAPDEDRAARKLLAAKRTTAAP